MIRKILSLPTLALCFTLGSAFFAGCNEDYIKNTETKVRWSNVKNPKYGDYINITLKAEGETFTTVGDHSRILCGSYQRVLKIVSEIWVLVASSGYFIKNGAIIGVEDATNN